MRYLLNLFWRKKSKGGLRGFVQLFRRKRRGAAIEKAKEWWACEKDGEWVKFTRSTSPSPVPTKAFAYQLSSATAVPSCLLSDEQSPKSKLRLFFSVCKFYRYHLKHLLSCPCPFGCSSAIPQWSKATSAGSSPTLRSSLRLLLVFLLWRNVVYIVFWMAMTQSKLFKIDTRTSTYRFSWVISSS